MFAKVGVLALLAVGSLAMPQLGLDNFNNEVNDNLGGPFDSNPQYTYAYQVSDDDEQTYIAHEENRDGENVQGQYSYVDPLGSLITVEYTAGADGYLETRNVQEGFVSIRSSSSGAVAAPVRPVRPSRPVVTQQTTTTTSSSGNNDLVARIIAQLTPFIQQTVSSTLSSGSRQTGQTVSTRPARPAPVQPAQPARGGGSVTSVFGQGGANNVRFDTPNFNFAYDLQK